MEDAPQQEESLARLSATPSAVTDSTRRTHFLCSFYPSPLYIIFPLERLSHASFFMSFVANPLDTPPPFAEGKPHCLVQALFFLCQEMEMKYVTIQDKN